MTVGEGTTADVAVRIEGLPRYSWLVRRWGGWRRRGEGGSGSANPDWFGALDDHGAGDDLVGWLVGIVVVVVGGLLLWFLVIPLLLVVLDGVLVVVLLVAALLARTLLGRPWRVTAFRGDAAVASVEVRGLRRARRVRDEARRLLVAGADVSAVLPSALATAR